MTEVEQKFSPNIIKPKTNQYALIILGRGIERISGSENTLSNWRLSRLVEEKSFHTQPHSGTREKPIDADDPNAFVAGSNANVIAAAKYVEAFPPKTIIFPTGRPRYLQPTDPTESSVMADKFIKFPGTQELITKNNINILALDVSRNTQEDIETGYAAAITAGAEEVIFLSVGIHLPRLEAMAKHYKDAHAIETPTSFQSADDVLLTYGSSLYEPIFDRLHNSEAHRRTLTSEVRGITDLQNGSYKTHQEITV